MSVRGVGGGARGIVELEYIRLQRIPHRQPIPDIQRLLGKILGVAPSCQFIELSAVRGLHLITPRSMVRRFVSVSWPRPVRTLTATIDKIATANRARIIRRGCKGTVLVYHAIARRNCESLGECSIKRSAAWLEVELFDELAGLAGAVFAVHPAVFPLHG